MTKIAFHICNITETGRELLDSEPLPSLVLPSVRVIHVKVRQVGYAQLVQSQQCRERLFSPLLSTITESVTFGKGRSEMITLPPYYHSLATSGQVGRD